MKHSSTISALLVAGLLVTAPAAWAQSASWASFSFSVQPDREEKVVKLIDKLMSSEVGQEFPGRLLLQTAVADGDDPATHSIVPVYRSVAEREAFLQKMQPSSDWQKFRKKFGDVTVARSSVLYRTVRNWGEIVDSDRVWVTHAFSVSNPRDFLSAIEAFAASSTFQKFPGQVYLSSVVAGGTSPITHVISVGYASETEMDEWGRLRDASRDWQRYVDASRRASEYLGASLGRTVKAWGPAGLGEIVGR